MGHVVFISIHFAHVMGVMYMGWRCEGGLSLLIQKRCPGIALD